jgi:hypothetical protein
MRSSSLLGSVFGTNPRGYLSIFRGSLSLGNTPQNFLLVTGSCSKAWVIWAVFIQSNRRQRFFRNRCEWYSRTLRNIRDSLRLLARQRTEYQWPDFLFTPSTLKWGEAPHISGVKSNAYTGVTFGKFFSGYIVSCVVIHFPSTREQCGECFDVFRCCTILKLQRFKWHFFCVHGYSNGGHAEMLEVVRILF